MVNKLRARGSVVAITGTNRGLGRALAHAFAAAGARLLVHARRVEDAEEVAREVRDATGAQVESVGGELTDPSTPAALAETARRAYGRLDGLVLNAAILGPMGTLEELEPQVLSHVLDVDVVAQFALFRACWPLLERSPRPVVFWLSSGLGRFGLPRYGAYCAAKHAVEGLCKVAAAEHADDGLVSVAMAPGMVQTEMLRAALEGEDMAPYQSPEETAAGFVEFFAAAGPEHNGASLDIEPFMAAAGRRRG